MEKEQTEENYDRIERLKKIYAVWKEKQLSNELFEIEEYIIADPDEISLDERW